MQLSQEGFQNFFRGVVNPLVYPAMIYTCVDESNSSTHSLYGLYYSGAIHKGRPQNLTPLSPVSAYVGLLLSKINSSVRSRQTPIPLLVRMCFMDDPSLIYKYAAHTRTLPRTRGHCRAGLTFWEILFQFSENNYMNPTEMEEFMIPWHWNHLETWDKYDTFVFWALNYILVAPRNVSYWFHFTEFSTEMERAVKFL